MLTRRDFLVTLGRGASTTLMTCAAASARVSSYRCLASDTAAFLEAACERFIPATASSPGATAAGVTAYIDAQLASPWGSGVASRATPWQAASPLPRRPSSLPPATYVSTAVRAMRRRLLPALFEASRPDLQRRLLEQLRLEPVDLDGVPSDDFLDLLLTLSVEGYFSHPRYAATRDRIDWPMPEYSGAYAAVSGELG